MKDTELHTELLRLRQLRRAREVKPDLAAGLIDVRIEHAEGVEFLCPECRKLAPIYNHPDGREGRRRDTCDRRTCVHACLPRVACPRHGVRRIMASRSSPDTPAHTLEFEAPKIDILKECDTSGAMRPARPGRDECRDVLERALARAPARKERRLARFMSVDEKACAGRHRNMQWSPPKEPQALKLL